MILLDTNALIWWASGHRRSLPLNRWSGRVRPKVSVQALAADPRWLLDSPPAADWFERALDLSWTRDPWDRLLVAHALQRKWRLATADSLLLSSMDQRHLLEL